MLDLGTQFSTSHSNFSLQQMLNNKSAVLIEGGIHLTINDFSGINATGNNSSFAIGINNTSSNAVQTGLTDLTQNLLEEIAKLNLPMDQKEEITETIKAISENAQKEKPNKTMIAGMFSALKTGMEVITKSPALIEVYNKWNVFIAPFVGN